MTATLTPLIFLVLALGFLGLAIWERGRRGSNLSLSARIWLRMALIFAIVSGYLFWFLR